MYPRTLNSGFLLLALASLALAPMGCKKAPPITLSCNATAPALYQGEPQT